MDAAVLQVQQAYVRAVVTRLNEHRNLLWEISNETMASSYAWQYHLVEFIREVEAGLPLQHPVGMTAMVRGGTDEQLIASPADWISPAMANYKVPTCPNATGKVVLLDTDHLWGLGGTAEWVRQAVANGYNPIFMDPYHGKVVPETWNGGSAAAWEAVRKALGDAVVAMDAEHVPDQEPTGAATVTHVTVAPASGDTGTSFSFSCRYTNPAGAAPQGAWLVVAKDGRRTFVPAAAGGTSWSEGVTCSAATKLSAGAYTYQFEFTTAGATHWGDPASGSTLVVIEEPGAPAPVAVSVPHDFKVGVRNADGCGLAITATAWDVARGTLTVEVA